MSRDLNTMGAIQEQKANELKTQAIQPLNLEGVALAEHKRFTFDIIDTPVDPLR